MVDGETICPWCDLMSNMDSRKSCDTNDGHDDMLYQVFALESVLILTILRVSGAGSNWV